MNESQNSPEITDVQLVEPTVVDSNPIIDTPVINNKAPYDHIDKIIDPINDVQPGKLKAVGRHKTNGPVKLGAIVLFEGKIPAIVTGVWPDGTLNLTLFPDALPMLDIKSRVPLYKEGDVANTWEHIK